MFSPKMRAFACVFDQTNGLLAAAAWLNRKALSIGQ
jgi:hypothetical protein